MDEKTDKIKALQEDPDSFWEEESLVVELPIETEIDLHLFTPREIPSVVEEYLFQCMQKNYKEVRIIHGKGIGVQRRIVQSLLQKHPDVESFHNAPFDRGGQGATIVRLKSRHIDDDE